MHIFLIMFTFFCIEFIQSQDNKWIPIPNFPNKYIYVGFRLVPPANSWGEALVRCMALNNPPAYLVRLENYTYEKAVFEEVLKVTSLATVTTGELRKVTFSLHAQI